MDLMIDIETLDTKAGGVILSIGYVTFNPQQLHTFDDLINRGQRIICDIQSQLDAGATVSFSTLQYWAAKDAESRERAFWPERVSFPTALRAARYESNIAERVWSKGYMDIAMLNFSGQRFISEDIIPFRSHRDLRTLIDVPSFEYPESPEGFIAHDPLHDAALQVLILQSLRPPKLILNNSELSISSIPDLRGLINGRDT